MKVVLLAGGLGTRLSEETVLKPKPMVEVGGMPILWHIMKIYSSHGLNDFVICLGYKGYLIKEYFANYFLHKSDVTIKLSDNSIQYHDSWVEPWNITLVDTGAEAMTGGRLLKVKPYLNNAPFLMTYGDGVGNINIAETIRFHQAEKKLCTITAVQPTGRFGVMNLGDQNQVVSFIEKPKADGQDSAWINGGFFVCQPEVINYIKDEMTIWEKEPLEQLAAQNQLSAYKHLGYWKPMDTLRDKLELEENWKENKAQWKTWK